MILLNFHYRVFSRESLFLDVSENVDPEEGSQSTIYVNDNYSIPLIHGKPNKRINVLITDVVICIKLKLS